MGRPTERIDPVVRAFADLVCGDAGPKYRTFRELGDFFDGLGLHVEPEIGMTRHELARVAVARAREQRVLSRVAAALADPDQYGGDHEMAREGAHRAAAILEGGGKPTLEQRLVRPGVSESVARALQGLLRSGVVSVPALLRGRRIYDPAFRLVLPDEQPPRIEYVLRSEADPSLVVEGDEIWTPGISVRLRTQKGAMHVLPLQHALQRAGRIFEPIARSLWRRRATTVTLTDDDAYDFIRVAAPRLQRAGFGAMLPRELAEGFTMRLHVGLPIEIEGPSAGMGQAALTGYRWDVALGDTAITESEFRAIAEAKRPLVRVRGQWVAVDAGDLERIGKRMRDRGTMPMANATGAALAGASLDDDAEVIAVGDVADAVQRLTAMADAPRSAPTPPDLRGTLRAYQERGLAWLQHLEEAGFGGCLADDMGLGKTVEVIAALLAARARAPERTGPTLIVCPASVVTNWERELERFAPSLPVVRHHGPTRARARANFEALLGPYAVVLTTYSLLRRDKAMLAEIAWERLVLDEAQNVKNPRAQQTRAAARIPAAHRFALTGTPVENRLGDLWSILELCNPGLLGTKTSFRERFAAGAERGEEEATERLRALVRPFVLRRVKSDPTVAADLPPKVEQTIWCPLTAEQATLYQAAVDVAMEEIANARGMSRRGKILALLTSLKQICDHPALYLKERAPLAGRSGKLERTTEMLDEVLSEGESALVFTQYAEMGKLLVAYLSETLGVEPAFLHGGVPLDERQRMIDEFQNGMPRLFVLSLKAGGTGVNLTRATHVFHYDRWWNPAVEDQATDRSHRIGQDRTVMVHTLAVAGTLEERIAELLGSKRDLAERVVGAGEGWLTELPIEELRSVVKLSSQDVEDLG